MSNPGGYAVVDADDEVYIARQLLSVTFSPLHSVDRVFRLP